MDISNDNYSIYSNCKDKQWYLAPESIIDSY